MIVITCVVGGAVLLSIGVLGEYVGRIYEEAKGRPLYVVSRSLNMTAAAAVSTEESPVHERQLEVVHERV
jgi:dolichol-phosphate mannosyltransferase